MPYDFTFKRVTIIDNKTALELNKSIASKLIASFPEVADPNPIDSNFFYTKTEIDINKEFPDSHFYLEGDIDNFFYFFQFWKDRLYIELGAGGDIVKRFKHIWKYSEIILKQGFQIEDPLGDDLLSPEVGFERHLQEYKTWVGFVDQVIRLQEPLN